MLESHSHEERWGELGRVEPGLVETHGTSSWARSLFTIFVNVYARQPHHRKSTFNINGMAVQGVTGDGLSHVSLCDFCRDIPMQSHPS